MAQPDYLKFEKSLRKLETLPDPEYRRILDRLGRLVERAEAIVERSESLPEK